MSGLYRSAATLFSVSRRTVQGVETSPN
jgi:hypothetical protein